MIYLYAITPHSDGALPGMLGLNNEPIKRFRVNEIEAIISDCSKVQSNPTPSTLWMHEGVVEALMKERCTLPVCYGTCLENEGELDRMIRAGYDSLLHDLDRLNGCIELGLRVIPTGKARKTRQEEPASRRLPAESGSLYMQSRMEALKKNAAPVLDTDAAEIHRRLLDKVVDGKYEIHDRPVSMITGAYLVQKVNLHQVQNIIGELRMQLNEYKIMCTGPWPPYNFVTPTLSFTSAN